ncbi:MAG: glycosyltransferase family 2 protein [Eubacteriales bacterium]|nr:glycosyltransferase family 2 protein [Eubacteriales bacterium]
MRTLIIIPAYNEEESILNTINNVRFHCPDMDYVIVNDGSSDNTREICIQNSFPLLDLPINLGLSGAFQTGMRFAYENGYDAAIQIDGDGQHDAVYIKPMIEKMQNNSADIIIGSRFLTERKPHSMRTFGSSLISAAILMTARKYIGDPTSGMRLYGCRMLDLFANSINFGPEPDTIAYLIRKGYSVEEFQLHMNERTAGKSYLNPIRSVKYMIQMFFSILFVQFFR